METKKFVFITILILYLVNAISVSAEYLARVEDNEGWTVFNASSDTRLMYVSTDGDDSTAQFYSPSDAEIGANPFNPTGAIKTYATFSMAFSQVRDGYPDWVLLKRGDTFSFAGLGTINKNGRSKYEPIVIGSYGSSGNSPTVNTGTNTGIAINRSYIAIFGIDFYANDRDYDATGTMLPGNPGLNIYVSTNVCRGILVEGCKFRYYTNGVLLQNVGDSSLDIELRRNLIVKNYESDYASGSDGVSSDHIGPTYTFTSATGGFNKFYSYTKLKIISTGDGGHAIVNAYTVDSVIDDNTIELTEDPTDGNDETGIEWYSSVNDSQGIYSYHASNLCLEGNIFWHNGWRIVSTSEGRDRRYAQATTWNHGVYLNSTENLEIVGNIILEPSASGIKITRKYTTSQSIIKNNILVASEDLIQAGNNYTSADYDYNLKNFYIYNNVYTNGGKDNHTNIAVSGIHVGGVDGGYVRNNLLINYDTSLTETTSLSFGYSKSRNLTIDGNISYNTATKRLFNAGSTQSESSGVVFSNNKLQIPSKEITVGICSVDFDSSGIFSFFGNKYYAPSQIFYFNGATVDLSAWSGLSGDNSTWEQVSFTDSSRDVDTYMEYIGDTPATVDGFITKCTEQGRYTWDSNYEADAVNDWIRAGFDLSEYIAPNESSRTSKMSGNFTVH